MNISMVLLVRVNREIDLDRPIIPAEVSEPIVVVPIDRWTRISEKALSFALSMSSDIRCVHVETGDSKDPFCDAWQHNIVTPLQAAGRSIPKLVTLKSPFRYIVQPIVNYALDVERESATCKVCVLVPELVVRHWWEDLLSNTNEPRNTHITNHFPHFDPARIAQFAALIVAAAVVAFVLFFVFLYLNSIFRFILFESVVTKRCSIGEGWSRWRRAGRRYFLWQIVLMIAQGLFIGVLIGVPLALAAALGWFRNADEHIARSVLGVIFLLGLFFLCLLVAAAVQLLAKDFLVPIMALENVDFADGWSRLLALIRPELGNYVIYLLLKIVLAIAAAIIFGILTSIPIFVLVVPAVLAMFSAGYKAGLGAIRCNEARISNNMAANCYLIQSIDNDHGCMKVL